VQMLGPGAVQLDLRYVVSGAQWTASYDIRIQSSDQSMSLTYYGLVSQSTGEDWPNVQLSLSTATPSKGGVPPTLATRYAEFYAPSHVRPFAAKMKKSRMSSAPGARSERRRVRKWATEGVLDDLVSDCPVLVHDREGRG
jgi:uncharacterized protein (TIGR02231 family)